MSTELPPVPESCTQCPHLDEFHSTCGHDLNQAIVRELGTGGDVCPLFSEVRAEAMRSLEERIE